MNGKMEEYISKDGSIKRSRYVPEKSDYAQKKNTNLNGYQSESPDGSVKSFKYEKRKKHLLLIDGDNSLHGLEGLGEIKKRFDEIKCWTVVDGNKRHIEKNYGIDVEVIPQKKQAVDNKIKEHIRQLNQTEYSGIYIISQDKGYDSVVNAIVKRENTIKELRYDIEKG